MVASSICLAAKFGDHLAVYLYAALGDQLFGVSTAGDAGLRQDFLEAFQFSGWFLRGLAALFIACTLGVLVGSRFWTCAAGLFESIARRGVDCCFS
jgi:hypothetical protein